MPFPTKSLFIPHFPFYIMKKKNKKSKKLKILAAGDLHGDSDLATKLAEKAEKKKVDLVILAGDINGMFENSDVIKPFKDKHQKVVFVPGNWDSTLETKTLKELHKVKNLDGYYVNYGNVGIAGIGSPDFQLFLDEKKSFSKLEYVFNKMKSPKKILVSHLHAKGTKAEFSGFEGSKVIREAIDKFHPDIFISAHIHEAEGIGEKIGKTKIIQVGRKGKIIKL